LREKKRREVGREKMTGRRGEKEKGKEEKVE
jgi:hypothetical protein